MLETKQREIDGVTFSVEMLDGKSSRGVFVRVVKLLGPSLADLAKSGAESILDADHTVALGALAKLTEGLTEVDLEALVDVFSRKTKIAVGAAWVPVPDAVFAGKLLTMFKWLAFCLEVNYSDFLGAFATTARPAAPKATESLSPSPLP